MLNGYVEFFMDSSLADCYLQLKEELDKLIENKVSRIWIYNYYFLKQRQTSLLIIRIHFTRELYKQLNKRKKNRDQKVLNLLFD